MRGATSIHRIITDTIKFQSTRPVRGATIQGPSLGPNFIISIHAPRAGRDDFNSFNDIQWNYFNPRAPCGARLILLPVPCPMMRFQSTRPVRGATLGTALIAGPSAKFQSTRPVRGATLRLFAPDDLFYISIHAPRAGRDEAKKKKGAHSRISIHAPRAGRDEN